MRIAAISDTHGRTEWEIPTCDIFIHAGDLTADGSLAETAAFAKRLRQAMRSEDGPKWAMIVPGNHDACFASQLPEVRALFGPNVHVLIGESITICGVRFFGSTWTPRCMRWYFMLSEEELAVHYRSIPDPSTSLSRTGRRGAFLIPAGRRIMRARWR